MNDKIKEMCKERGFYYLNLTEAFTGEDGYLTADYAQNDGIHLTVAGYSHWVTTCAPCAVQQKQPLPAGQHLLSFGRTAAADCRPAVNKDNTA